MNKKLRSIKKTHHDSNVSELLFYLRMTPHVTHPCHTNKKQKPIFKQFNFDLGPLFLVSVIV